MKKGETTKMNETEPKRVNNEKLRIIVFKILIAAGLPENDAKIVCDCLIASDLNGVNTHGVSILAAHVNRIENGGYKINPIIKVVKKTSSFSIVDSVNSIGFVSAVFSMNLAIQNALKSGIYTVFSRNANTYGAAFFYAEMAAKNGLIGITFSNSPAAMAPWGGKEKLLGTNPFAIAIPGNGEEIIIFDFASSKVAKSKIKQALEKGEKIPMDWANDENGKPTDEPIEAIKGMIMPMAQHKGYGIALVIDILAGVLSGSSFLNNVGKFYSDDEKSMNIGQTFLAIDPKAIFGKDFYNVISHYCERIRKSKSKDKNSVRVPGDGKRYYKQENIEYGIPLHEKTVYQIQLLQKKYKILENLFEHSNENTNNSII